MSSNKRILIAEDDFPIALALKTIVASNIGCEVEMVVNGREAWEALQKKPFDLVLSDWNMPEMTGAQLRAEMRAVPHLAKIPFIMLTARGDKESVVEAVSAGITDYVHKPFKRTSLLEKIRTRLG